MHSAAFCAAALLALASVAAGLVAPNVRSQHVCVSVDKVLTGKCHPWIYAATVAGQIPPSGSAIVVRDTSTRKTWLEVELNGFDVTKSQYALGYNFPCETQRGGPFPYQQFEHNAYGLASYIDNNGVFRGTDDIDAYPGTPFLNNRVEFDGNLLNATRDHTTDPIPYVTGTSPIVISNGGGFDYIARPELRSIVVFQGTNLTDPNEVFSRVVCCNLEANTKQRKKDTKAPKEKTTKRTTTKKRSV